MTPSKPVVLALLSPANLPCNSLLHPLLLTHSLNHKSRVVCLFVFAAGEDW